MSGAMDHAGSVTKTSRRSATLAKLAFTVLLSCAASLPGAARGQVAEAAVRPIDFGFHLPTLGGSLIYAVNTSESVSTGYYSQGDAALSTNVSGDLAYISRSQTHPFSMVYSGGVLARNANQPTVVVQNLALSQVLDTRLWNFSVTDSASYLPSTSTTGLSGVAGLGDMGVDLVSTGPITGQGALTAYAPRVGNVITAGIVRRLTGKTSLQGTGSFAMQRFTGDGAGLIDSNQVLGSLGVSHIIDARSIVSAAYTRSKITYRPDTLSSAFDIQGVNFSYSRQLNRRFSFDASVGPQWIKTYFNGPHTGLDLATDVVVGYKTRLTSTTASYVRGTNNGFGVLPGGFSDSFNSSSHRTFGRIWSAAVTFNYTRTTNPGALDLPVYSLHTLVAGIQGGRAITRSLSTYASYNAQHQSASGVADTSGAFRGLFQIVSFGITYSPRTISFGAPQ